MTVSTGAVTGWPRRLLRLEGLAALVFAVWAWEDWGASWPVFAGFFFAPDLSFLGYLRGPRVGAALYNAAHTYLGPALCGLAFALGGPVLLREVALVWLAHIGFDRAVGYGLKYPTGFHSTHLGRIGRGGQNLAVGGRD
jgi:hypothetical protein